MAPGGVEIETSCREKRDEVRAWMARERERINCERDDKEGERIAAASRSPIKLVVVAIVAVLVAIAVPVFTSSMDSANKAPRMQRFTVRFSSRSATEIRFLIVLWRRMEKIFRYATATVDSHGNITNLAVSTGSVDEEGYTAGLVMKVVPVAAKHHRYLGYLGWWV